MKRLILTGILLVLAGCKTYTLKEVDMVGIKDGKPDVFKIKCVRPIRVIDHGKTVKKPDGTDYTSQDIAQLCINGKIVTP